MINKKRFILGMVIAITSVALVSCTSVNDKDKSNNKGQKTKEITVSAAASLKESLEEIKDNYEKENNIKINVNYASSGTVKKQVEEGAPIDILFLADKEYMTELERQEKIDESLSRDLLSNQLVVIENNKAEEKITNLEDLKNGDFKIGLGDFKTVPVGRYSKEALENKNVFSSIENRIIYGKEVKSIASYVDSGEVICGIVYKSDAKHTKNSKVVYEVPKDLHGKIIYTMGLVKDSLEKEESKNFLDYISSDKSKEIFEKNGFIINE